ncbi:MAG: IS5 family transposase [Betaproteobacteria bacterium]|nr:MAG: IS5 family transposase [Betaproteobacteria bacterium]
MNGIFWILRTGAPWADLPGRFPSYQTCHRRFQEWVELGTLKTVLEALAEDLRSRGKLDLSECFIDATFVVGKTKRGKGTKIMAVADGNDLPAAIHVASASPHEVTLVEDTVEDRFVADTPERLIGDKAYDSDKLDAKLEQQGIELIAPHRANRIRPVTQVGRALRRYKRRWKVERLFAWLQHFRRILSRHEYHAANFLGFVQLGCLSILMRQYF